ncbi:MAG: glycosyltransferase [Longimicrobiales bacterium]|nr:glycosyltransferase [Longimicrobiales bacterium]
MWSLDILAWILVTGAVITPLYAYLGYPLLLRMAARESTDRRAPETRPWELPTVSITVPAYNEEDHIADVLERLLRADYPAERLQILVVSDASSDRTDEIVESFRDRGVELHRRTSRRGKTAAENAAGPLLRGEIVVNTDASVKVEPGAIRALVERFRDPAVGLASGRDVSVAADSHEQNAGESRYVGYEMRVRAMETRAGGIVGASGCLYAIRRELHLVPLPGNLSRDFAAALITRERGFRAVSVDDAVCRVPRTGSLRREYRRKVRTMVRGMRTLAFKRALLDPRRHGTFAWKLWSHKICRWLVPWALAGGAVGALLLSRWLPTAVIPVLPTLLLGGVLLTAVAWHWPAARPMPALLSSLAHGVLSNLAAMEAALRAPMKTGSAVWDPTPRGTTSGLSAQARTNADGVRSPQS